MVGRGDRWRRNVALFFLWIIVGVWPTTWLSAYAQTLPYQVPAPEPGIGVLLAQAEAGDMGWLGSDAAENKALNKRAAQLMRPRNHETIRGPTVVPDNDPVRTPDLEPDPGEEQRAQERAATLPQLSVGEIVEGAQRGQDLGATLLNSPAVANPVLDESRANPGANDTRGSHVNIGEILPGYSASQVELLKQQGAAFADDPEQIKAAAEAQRRYATANGCRKTAFRRMEEQHVTQAPASAANRILMVEFFDIEKTPIAGTNPVQYEMTAKPGAYKRGHVDLAVATIGGTDSVRWDIVDDTTAIKYTYTPYTAPSDQNYFTYGTELATDLGAGPQVVAGAIQSYGAPSDAWTPAITYVPTQGVRAIYIAADLYQSEVTYDQPAPGATCPPDPPAICTVPRIGGGSLQWCSGSPGANVLLMYDDEANPQYSKRGLSHASSASINVESHDYSTDAALIGSVTRQRNAATSELAQEMAGTCVRAPISQTFVDIGQSYGVENIQACSEALVNPYPKGCDRISRNFGLSYVGEQNYLTVRAFNKIKVPIIDPKTGEQMVNDDKKPIYTYKKEPANVTGPVSTAYAIMGMSACVSAVCSTEKRPDDPLGTSEGYYLEYSHSPLGGSPQKFAINRVYVQSGGVGSFSNYGKPTNSWYPSGSASGDGSAHQLRLTASVYAVTVNAFAGCENYMNYVADKVCTGAKLVCTDTAPTRTVGGVTFGPGLPNNGIVDLLKQWGTDASAVHYEIADGIGADPTPSGPPIKMIDDPMCWVARGTTFEYCESMDHLEGQGGGLTHYFKGDGSEWATDCDISPDEEGTPLPRSSMCRRAEKYDSCDTRQQGLFTDVCYDPSIAYDCGTRTDAKVPLIFGEQADFCNGVMRCVGTECHRPNLTGNHNDEFVSAVTAMEATNAMVADIICAETGAAPTSPTQACTPLVFNGTAAYCKIPIGHQIGITPNCCQEARKGVKGGPSWMEYLVAAQSLSKIVRNTTFQNFLTNFDAYNQTANFFGEVAKPVTDLWASASSWATENVVQPFSAGFDNLFGSFFNSGSAGAVPAQIGTGQVVKQASIGGAIDALKTKLMNTVYEVLKTINPDVANAMFVNGGTTAIELSPQAAQLLQAFQTVMLVYSIARIIGHIIFACKQAEFEWAMNDRWRLCTFVDTCCNKKKFLIGCIEKRQLYCCYKSIATRVISEQITKKNLVGSRPFGYRTAPGDPSRKLGKCDINCGGFKPTELAMVDWAQVDLTEWTDALTESGMFHSIDPRNDYGVSDQGVETTQAVGRTKDSEGQFDQRSPAFKTFEGLKESGGQMSEFTETLRETGIEHCYDEDNNKMPFTYPGCRTTSSPNNNNSNGGKP